MSSSARQLPAFGRELVEKRRRGLAPTRDLMIATDWHLGRLWPWRIVVSSDVDPTQLDFSIAAGLSCLIAGFNSERMDEVARAIIPFGPSRLIGIRAFGDRRVTVYLPGDPELIAA